MMSQLDTTLCGPLYFLIFVSKPKKNNYRESEGVLFLLNFHSHVIEPHKPKV